MPRTETSPTDGRTPQTPAEPPRRFLITETTEHSVEAHTREAAEELFLDHGPGDSEPPVQFIGVVERRVEPADTPT
jgi:hypothetical protein